MSLLLDGFIAQSSCHWKCRQIRYFDCSGQSADLRQWYIPAIIPTSFQSKRSGLFEGLITLQLIVRRHCVYGFQIDWHSGLHDFWCVFYRIWLTSWSVGTSMPHSPNTWLTWRHSRWFDFTTTGLKILVSRWRYLVSSWRTSKPILRYYDIHVLLRNLSISRCWIFCASCSFLKFLCALSLTGFRLWSKRQRWWWRHAHARGVHHKDCCSAQVSMFLTFDIVKSCEVIVLKATRYAHYTCALFISGFSRQWLRVWATTFSRRKKDQSRWSTCSTRHRASSRAFTARASTCSASECCWQVGMFDFTRSGHNRSLEASSLFIVTI